MSGRRFAAVAVVSFLFNDCGGAANVGHVREHDMKCWFCDNEARGTCAACGRGLCYDHAHIHDAMTLAKTDTSSGYSSYYNVLNSLKCSDCRLEWTFHKPESR